MTIAITGATGQLGRLVIAELLNTSPSEAIVALVRDLEKASDLPIEKRQFDYDAAETLASSLAGIDTLLLISSSEIGRRVEQHASVIAAAKTAGVKHIIYTSLLNADSSSLSLAAEHVATEAALKDSGIEHTILRNGWYTENYTMSVPTAIEHKAFIGAAQNGRISSATRQDYAKAAAFVLLNKDLRGKTYELSGDDSYTLSDLASVLSEKAGETIPYVDLSPTDYAAALTKAGLPEQLAGFLAHCDEEASKGALFDEGKQLSQLIGSPTTPLAAAVSRALA